METEAGDSTTAKPSDDETELKVGATTGSPTKNCEPPAAIKEVTPDRKSTDTTDDNDKNDVEDKDKTKDPAPTNTSVQTTIPVYSKPRLPPAALCPVQDPQGKEYTRALVNTGTRCGATLSWLVGPSGKFVYDYPLMQKMRNNAVRAREDYKVDRVMVMRDPKLDQVWEELTGKRDKDGNKQKRLRNVLVHIPDNINRDPVSFRKQLRQLYIAHYNAPSVQAQMFGNNTLAYDGGDLTPTKDLPYISDFFTVKHTLDLLEYAFSGSKTREEIADDETLLAYYFPEKMFDKVRESIRITMARRQGHSESATDDGPTFDSMS